MMLFRNDTISLNNTLLLDLKRPNNKRTVMRSERVSKDLSLIYFVFHYLT